jgi:cytidylate kinase
MPVITVSRQFGSGGSDVAARVAGVLGWRLVDNEMVDGIARRLGTTPAAVEAIDERSPSLAERLADMFAFGSGEIVSAPLHGPLPPTVERVLEVTRRVIEDAAARGPVVLVGRGAQASLATRTDALHVFCCAPQAALVERVMMREGLSADEATRRVHDKNRQRAEFVKRSFGRDWLSPAHYHLCVNTASLGIEGAAELIVHLARQRFAPVRADQSERTSG